MNPNQIISIVIIFLLLLICLVFLLRKKLAGFLSISLRLGFVFLIFTILISVLIPGLYKSISSIYLREVGVEKKIEELDNLVFNSVVVESQKGVNDLKKLISDTFGMADQEVESEITESYFKDNLYPDLVLALASFLRFIIILFSFVGLILITYASYATTGFQDLYSLQKENQKLLIRIKRLEKVIL